MSDFPSRPEFHSVLFGINKREVEEYLASLEPVLAEAVQKAETCEASIRELNRELEVSREHCEELSRELEASRERCEELSRELDASRLRSGELTEKCKELSEKCGEMTAQLSDSARDPKVISEALVSAQRMKEVLLSEAQDEAKEIRTKAAGEARDIRDKARLAKVRIEGAARDAAERVERDACIRVQEAENRCMRLQQNYDRMLIEVTNFMTEIMNTYRKHMELLTNLPEPEVNLIDVRAREEMAVDADFVEPNFEKELEPYMVLGFEEDEVPDESGKTGKEE